MEAIKSVASHLEGSSGYKCVKGKGHLDNCKDPNGVCETNAICKFVDDIKRRGKLDKQDVTYSEANNIENGTNKKSSFELVFNLDYDINSGQRVSLRLLSPTVYEMDLSKYKYNKIMRMLDETLVNFVNDNQKYTVSSPFEAYNLISQIVFNNKRKFAKLRNVLAKKFEPLVQNNLKDYIDHILKHATEKRLNKVLVIENINHDNNYSLIQNFIQNIKQDLLREYTSTNRHIIPPLNPNFVANVEKHDPQYDIYMQDQYIGGGRKRRSTQKKSVVRKKNHRKTHAR